MGTRVRVLWMCLGFCGFLRVSAAAVEPVGAPEPLLAAPAERVLEPALPQQEAGQPDGPESRGQNFTDLPVPEISVGLLAGSVPAHDTAAQALGKSNGELVLLTREGHLVKSAYSSDNGATFGEEVVVAGPEPPVGIFRAALSSDGKLYLAYPFGDAGGDVGVRFQRSDDLGRTWTAPASLVKRGDATHGIVSVRAIAANGSGTVAVIYDEAWEAKGVYVTASTNGGANWTVPVRIDTYGFGITGADVAVGANGWIHAVFSQSRVMLGQVFYARSKTGGASFEAERNFDNLLIGRADSVGPDIEVGNDGSIVFTFWDASSASSDFVYVLRSANGGDSFTRTLASLQPNGTAFASRLSTAPGTNTALVGWVRPDGGLQLARSPDNGATWGTVQTLAAANANTHRAVRTSGTNWVVAWEDRRNAGLNATFTDIYVRVSTNDGASFGTEQRADRDPAGASESRLQTLAASGTDSFLVAYTDRRPSLDGYNVWANRSAANPLDLSVNERRADTDSGTDNRAQYNNAAVTSDGAEYVYIAYAAVSTGPWPDLFVAASADRGRTFTQTARVSTYPAGTADYKRPMLSAQPDGTVYVAYFRQPSTWVTYELVVNRSRDFGRTWLPDETFIGLANPGNTFDLRSLAAGRVYLAYTNGSSVFLARSSDYFDTFTGEEVDQDTTDSSKWPKLCAQGNQLILVFMSKNAALADSVWGTVSSDGGATWAPRVQLRPEGTAGAAQRPDLACNGANAGVAVFEDTRAGSNSTEVYSNRYDGSSWSASELIVDNGSAPRVAFYSGSGVVVTYENKFFSGDVWLRRSDDAGNSWGFAEFYGADEFAPQPRAESTAPYPITDGAGNIWVAWKDTSAGAASIAVSQFRQPQPWLPWAFGPVYRVNREQPQGVKTNSIERYQYQPGAALPGVAFVAFNGSRSSSYWDTRINAYEPGDMDRDGAAAVTDCNDADPGAAAAPVEVGGVAVSREPGATRVAWTSQAATAGAGTTYDVVTGYASDLLAAGTFGSASCLASALAAPPYDDARSGPPAQDSFYYLVRAKNGCGTATFGDASVSPDPRDALDGGAPCP